MQPACLRTREDRTRKVSALLTVCYKLRFIQPDENAEIAGVWIFEQFRAAHRQFVNICNRFNCGFALVGPESLQKHNPELTCDKGRAGAHEEFNEFAP